jgi:hypothetical protein
MVGVIQEVRRCEVRMVITLKNSARNCTLSRSLKLKFLNVEKSTVASPARKNLFRPELPTKTPPATVGAGVSNWGSNASKCPKASVYAAGHRIATGNELRMIHGEVAVETSVEGIASSAEGHGERRTARRGNDSAKLPSAEDVRCEFALWSGHGYLARQYDHFWEWRPRTNGRI